MSIGLFIKQKKFIELELEKGNKDYELIYKMAKERQFKEEKKGNERSKIQRLKDSIKKAAHRSRLR